jgi:tRNA (guanosine-2'-O-)-methyltransferase
MPAEYATFGLTSAMRAGGILTGGDNQTHRVDRRPLGRLQKQRERGLRIVGVEPADEAIRLADLPAARKPTVIVLGHEQHGIPPEALDLLDTCVEIPMIGIGGSLNVAVAGSLALYRLAGLL